MSNYYIDDKNWLYGVFSMWTKYFKYIFDYSPLPIYIFQDVHFRMVNPKMVQITGYSEDELLNVDFLELIHPEDRQLVADNVGRRLAGESVKEDYAFKAVDKLGNTIHVQGFYSIIDFEGSPAVLGQLLDISEQRNIEAALRKSKKELAEKVEHLNAIINNMNEYFFTYDRNGFITYANKKVLEIGGYDPGEMIDTSIFHYVPEQYRAEVAKKVVARLGQGISESYEVPLIHKDGTTRLSKLNASPIIEDGRITGGMVLAEDISKQRETEKVLEDERAFVSAILETVGAMVVVLDREGRIVRFNRACEQLTGYSFEEVSGMYLWDLLIPSKDEKTVRNVFESLSTGMFPSSFENYWLTRSGERRLISWSNTAIPDDYGMVKYVIGTGIDISARKQSEIKLILEKERLLVTLSSIGDAVIAVNSEGIVTLINPIAEILTGWSGKDAVGRPLVEVFNIINEITGEPVENPVQKVLTDGKIVGLANHTALISRDRSIVSIADSAAPIRDAGGEVLGVILVFRDVTEEKRRADALKSSEARLRLITDNMRDMITQINAQGTFIYVSPSIKTALGYNPEDLLGGKSVKFIHPDDRENVINVFQMSIKINSAARIEYRHKHANGSYIWVETVGNPIFQENDLLGMVFVSRDIAHRKMAEERLLDAHQQLLDIIEFLPDATFVIDSEKKVIAWNRAIEELTGVSKQDIIGMGDYAYAAPFYGEKRPVLVDLIFESNLEIEQEYDTISRKGNALYCEHYVPMVYNGKGAFISGLASPLYDTAGNLSGAIETIRDITERKLMENKMTHLSFHDSLTGLFNRACFEQEMRRLEMEQKAPVSIIVCDVDGLKLVNDSMGHDHGDALLIAAASVIKGAFRDGDIVARIGGDEFAVLLPNIGTVAVEQARGRIISAMNNHNSDYRDFPLSISIGYATGSGENINLAEIFKEADNNMYREKLHRSQSARSAIVLTLMKALEARDYITEGHAERLQYLAAGMAVACNMSSRNLSDLKLFAQFHDIGKVGIPDRILNKPGPLNQEEYNEMKRHCEIGHRIAQSSPDLVVLADWILKHHEWWNGEGYPLGLSGEDIPLECRILSIADAYDAMTSDRPYRKSMTHREAISELTGCSGTQFDPSIVKVFIKMLEKEFRHKT
jgi:diguanylate cyclase (GGDEF)-like protein/PAS domain S-box-containing protein